MIDLNIELKTAQEQINLLEKSSVGRPSAITAEVMLKLIAAFQVGVSDKTACVYAGISRETFYKRLREDEEFADKMEEAKSFLLLKAGQVIASALYKNSERAAMWILEKKEPKEFGKTKEVVVDSRPTYVGPSWYTPQGLENKKDAD